MTKKTEAEIQAERRTAADKELVAKAEAQVSDLTDDGGVVAPTGQEEYPVGASVGPDFRKAIYKKHKQQREHMTVEEVAATSLDIDLDAPREYWWCLEHEMKHRSWLATRYAKQSVVKFITAGKPIPDALKKYALKWLEEGMGEREQSKPNKRDRDRALYRRLKSHNIGVMSDETDVAKICKQIAAKGGDGWTKYRNAFRRLRDKGAVAAVTFIEDLSDHPGILKIQRLKVDDGEHVPCADREFARKIKQELD